MLDKYSSFGYVNKNLNEFNKFSMGNTDYSRLNSNAKNLNIDDNKVVKGIELDGFINNGSSFLEKQEEISQKQLGKSLNDKVIDNHKGDRKQDGFDKDCPLCECETCKNRRYQDVSNDSGVSFQNATKMNPKEAEHMVKAHENEHMRREQYTAKQEGKKIVSQSIQILMRNCQECGQPYVSGGLTRTYAKEQIDGYYDALLNNTKNLDMHKKFDFSA